jgi:tRNA nucleotidyltransferase/poly(A) polymerase
MVKLSRTHEEIVGKIRDGGFRAYVVGGAVRDSLMGVDADDIDIATDANYDALRTLFADRDTDEVGRSFQVMIIDGVEVATFRKDLKTVIAGRYGSRIHGAEPVSSLEEDLSRRDLTVNAIAWDPFEGEYVDPYGGIDDVRRKRIRFVGDPLRRIEEDPVRMLRACRFLATIERARFTEDALAALSYAPGWIRDVPKERIRIEIVKAMKARYAGNFFRALQNTGLLAHVLPCMNDTVGHPGGRYHPETVFEHCCEAVDCVTVDEPLLKLAAFLHDCGKPLSWKLNSNGGFAGHDRTGRETAQEALQALKFSVDETAYVTSLVGLHMSGIKADASPRAVRKMMARCDKAGVPVGHLVRLTIADHNANFGKTPHKTEVEYDRRMQLVRMEIERGSALSIRDLAIGGRDVMEICGIPPGPLVGEILDGLLELVVDDPALNNEGDLTERAVEILERKKRNAT